MRRADSYALIGLALVAVGVLALLQNLGLLAADIGILWALIFAVAGVGFLTVFVRNRAQWWALIPGCTLVALGALILLQDLIPTAPEPWGGALFLAGISLSFWLIYLSDRAQWWAIIPGGALLTVALIAGLSTTLAGPTLGGVLFLGLALTFGLVALLPTHREYTRWAVYPAGVLLVMALLSMAAMEQLALYLWPAALILAGLYLTYRTLRTQHG